MPRRSTRKRTLDEFNYCLQVDLVNSFVRHLIAESDDESDSDVDEDFLWSCFVKVGASVVLDNSQYLFCNDR
jgi:hypothetical protein